MKTMSHKTCHQISQRFWHHVNFCTPTRQVAPVLCLLSVLLLSACSLFGDAPPSATVVERSRISACKANDKLIANRTQCLQDDAACYQIADGQWCTGVRGSVCPAGSVRIDPGSDCPQGARCIQLSESLECKI